jgi:hypothetical protein
MISLQDIAEEEDDDDGCVLRLCFMLKINFLGKHKLRAKSGGRSNHLSIT